MASDFKFSVSKILSFMILTVFIFQTTLGGAPFAFADEVSFIHSDHISSSNVITDSAGSRVSLYEYDPYGRIVTHTGIDVKHRFTGQEADDSTNLYYYNARYMDPQLGRFISADESSQQPFDPQSLNRFAYGRNNPIKFTDPTGYGWFSKLMGAVAGAIAFVASGFNPVVGISTFAAIDATISARQNGASWGRALAIGAVGFSGGIAGGAFGSTIANAMGFAAGSFGGGVGAGIFAGAFAGSASAAVAGGDPVRGGLAGAAGGASGGVVGPVFGGLAGSFVGGGVSNLANGGSFINGAVNGIYYSIGTTVVSLVGIHGTPVEELIGQGKVKPSDRVYLRADVHPLGLLVAVVDPGPTSHVGTYVGGKNFVDAIHGRGAGVSQFQGKREGWVLPTSPINQKAVLAAANAMGVKGDISYFLPPFGHVCSTLSNQIRSDARVPPSVGIGPNAQFFNEKDKLKK